MTRRYRIRVIENLYIPQVKYGRQPWRTIGPDIFCYKEGAEAACDRHNADEDPELLGAESFKYIPKPPTK